MQVYVVARLGGPNCFYYCISIRSIKTSAAGEIKPSRMVALELQIQLSRVEKENL